LICALVEKENNRVTTNNMYRIRGVSYSDAGLFEITQAVFHFSENSV
jgi:hypothetical protein